MSVKYLDLNENIAPNVYECSLNITGARLNTSLCSPYSTFKWETFRKRCEVNMRKWRRIEPKVLKGKGEQIHGVLQLLYDERNVSVLFTNKRRTNAGKREGRMDLRFSNLYFIRVNAPSWKDEYLYSYSQTETFYFKLYSWYCTHVCLVLLHMESNKECGKSLCKWSNPLAPYGKANDTGNT